MNSQIIDISIRNICSYLPHADEVALAITSQTIYNILKETLLERKLTQLFSPFTITHRYNIQSLKDVDLFAIGEHHGNSKCISDQVALINFLVLRGPVILIMEGWPSMKPISVLDPVVPYHLFNQIRSSIPPTYINNIHAIGWDNQKQYSQLTTQIDLKYLEEVEQLINHKQNDFLSIISKLPKILWPSEKELAECEEFFEKNLDENVLPPSNFKRFYAIISSILDKGDKFLPNLEDKIEYIFQVPTKIIENDVQIRGRLCQLAKLFVNLMCSKLEINIEKTNRNDKAIRDTFPIRTQSMTQTIQEINEFLAISGIPYAKKVLISGTHHLNSNSVFYKEQINDPNYDVNPFYQALTNHRAAILLPTECIDLEKASVNVTVSLSESQKKQIVGVRMSGEMHIQVMQQSKIQLEKELERRKQLTLTKYLVKRV